MTSCSGCGGEKHATAEEINAAQTAGAARARELTPDMNSDTLALENALLDIRERETRLRSQGHDDVADTFIESFLATLDSVNPALAHDLH